jgi:hypothetical protein
VNHQEFAATRAVLLSHPDWTDQAVASSAQVSEEDVTAVREVIGSGPREQEPA